MSNLPWVRFFPSDWLAGTRGMSAVETGVYITMIMMMYEAHGPIRNDEARLARMCGLPVATFRKVNSSLLESGKISEVDGYLINDRVVAELKFGDEKSVAASKSSRARWGKSTVNSTRDECERNPNGMRTLCYPEPDTISSEPNGSSEDTPSPENPGHSPKPEIRPEANESDEIALAFDAYNAAAQSAGWPVAKTLSVPRRSALKRRMADAGGLDGWTSALGRARASPFLTGANDRGWRADLDFFLQARSFTKLIEGGYDQRNPVPKPDRFQTRQRITAGEANLLAAFTGCDRGGPEAGRSREPYPDFAASFDDGRTLDLVATHR